VNPTRFERMTFGTGIRRSTAELRVLTIIVTHIGAQVSRFEGERFCASDGFVMETGNMRSIAGVSWGTGTTGVQSCTTWADGVIVDRAYISA
jgi:hypothetical protein